MKQARPYVYPTPEEAGVRIPRHLVADRFRSGFSHALHGGQITEVAQLRQSFREGYRAGKLYLKALRQAQGVVAFPVLGRIRVRARPH